MVVGFIFPLYIVSDTSIALGTSVRKSVHLERDTVSDTLGVEYSLTIATVCNFLSTYILGVELADPSQPKRPMQC